MYKGVLISLKLKYVSHSNIKNPLESYMYLLLYAIIDFFQKVYLFFKKSSLTFLKSFF